MPHCNEYFVRTVYIDVLEVTLHLRQKLIGDVGCVVWDASIVLAKYLEVLYKKDREYFKNLNIIELGAGVGCVGLTAACLGANVLLTDLPDILPILEQNVELNKETLHNITAGKVQVSTLSWGEALEMEQKPDLIVLADCIYYKESIDPLILTLKNVCGSQTKVILSQEKRDSKKQESCWKYFLERVSQYFIYHFVALEEQHENFRSEDILLLQLVPI